MNQSFKIIIAAIVGVTVYLSLHTPMMIMLNELIPVIENTEQSIVAVIGGHIVNGIFGFISAIFIMKIMRKMS